MFARTNKSSVLATEAAAIVSNITNQIDKIEGLAGKMDAEAEVITAEQERLENQKVQMSESKDSILKISSNLKALLK